MTIEIREADFDDARDCRGFLAVLDGYAAGSTGGGAPLDPEVRARLIPALRAEASALVLLALMNGEVVGIANCFFGFSTFAALPLLNVHDLAVSRDFQRRGIGRALLAAAEERARSRGCCKLTLEVLESNERARQLYHERGFRDFQLAGKSHTTLFLSKSLGASSA